MAVSTGGSSESPQAKLARKLYLLLDLFESQRPGPLSYREISDKMAELGTPLSRSRWAYMRSGDSSFSMDRDLLQNLAAFFGVDRRYLLDDSAEVPDLVEAQLELLKSMREARVKNFAARQLQDLSPETLARLQEVIDKHVGNDDENS
ncbi:UNVERIFIED_ORG: transcriptional regulator with XRE-family HTH domain [Arthrobacter sp. UYCu721]